MGKNERADRWSIGGPADRSGLPEGFHLESAIVADNFLKGGVLWKPAPKSNAMPMKKLLAWMLMTIAAVADEKSNAPTPVGITTNYVKAHWSFRRVDGKLYNIEKSVLWSDIKGTCIRMLTNGILVRTVVEKREILRIPASDAGPSISNILLGGRTPAPSVQTRKWEEDGPEIFLENYDGPELTTGRMIRVKALRNGTYANEGDLIEKWDCGTPNMVAVIVTNQPALISNTNRPSTKQTPTK